MKYPLFSKNYKMANLVFVSGSNCSFWRHPSLKINISHGTRLSEIAQVRAFPAKGDQTE
jgi:hypothetical protein